MTRKEIKTSIERFSSQMSKISDINDGLNSDDAFADRFYERVESAGIKDEKDLLMFILSI